MGAWQSRQQRFACSTRWWGQGASGGVGVVRSLWRWGCGSLGGSGGGLLYVAFGMGRRCGWRHLVGTVGGAVSAAVGGMTPSVVVETYFITFVSFYHFLPESDAHMLMDDPS